MKSGWQVEWRAVLRCSCGRDIAFSTSRGQTDALDALAGWIQSRARSSDPRSRPAKAVETHTTTHWYGQPRRGHAVHVETLARFECRCGFRTAYLNNKQARRALQSHDCDAHRRSMEVLRAMQ